MAQVVGEFHGDAKESTSQQILNAQSEQALESSVTDVKAIIGETTDTGGTTTTGTLMAKSNNICSLVDRTRYQVGTSQLNRSLHKKIGEGLDFNTSDDTLFGVANRLLTAQSNQALESTLQAVVTKLDSFTDRAVTGA